MPPGRKVFLTFTMADEKPSLKTSVIELPPCKICGGKASGIHYGVNSCEACKGFYRRYMARRQPYICKKNKNCVITDRPRGNCSACRMQKCLDLGMSKEAVRQGRYTLSERTQAIIEVKRLRQTENQDSITTSTSTDQLSSATNDEDSLLTSSIDESVDKDHQDHQMSSDDLLSTTASDGGDRTLTSGFDKGVEENQLSSDDQYLTALDDYGSFLISEMEQEHQMTLGDKPASASINFSSIPAAAVYSKPNVTRFPEQAKSQHDCDETQTKGSLQHVSHQNTVSSEDITSAFLSSSHHGSSASSSPSNSVAGTASPTNSTLSYANDSKTRKDKIMAHFVSQMRDECESIETSLSTPGAGTTAFSEQEIDRVLDNIMPKLLHRIKELLPGTSRSDQELQVIFNEAYQNYKMKEEMFGSMKSVSREDYHHIYKTTGIDIDGRLLLSQKNHVNHEGCMKKIVRFVKLIPGFRDLPLDDQWSLVKASIFEFYIILGHRNVDPDKEMLIYIYDETVYHIDELCGHISKNFLKPMMEFTRTIRKLDLNKEELALVLTICVLFKDRCRLMDPERVENIQLTMISYLRFLLKKRYDKDESKAFTNIMSMFFSIRGLIEQFMVVYKELCCDELLVKQCPEYLLFLEDL